MSESIFARVQRVVSAGLDSAVATVERANSHGMMREAMRDADRAIDRLVAERDAAQGLRHGAETRAAALRQELGTLDEQARFALSKERTDLAEAAIARQVELEEQIAELDAARAQAVVDEGRLETAIAELRARRQQMKDALAALRETQSAAVAATPIDERMAQRVGRAEAAFERALENAAVTRGETPAVAEITALQRQAVVAERLAALRAGELPKRATRRRTR